LKAAKVALFGPDTDGPMAPELPILYKDEAPQLKLVVKAEPVRSCGTNSDQRAAGQQ
jgi:hypothetical protein